MPSTLSPSSPYLLLLHLRSSIIVLFKRLTEDPQCQHHAAQIAHVVLGNARETEFLARGLVPELRGRFPRRCGVCGGVDSLIITHHMAVLLPLGVV